MSEAVDVSDPYVKDTSGKTDEPTIVSEKFADVVGKDVPGRDGVYVSHVNMVTEGMEVPSTEGLGVDVDHIVEETLDGLKDSTPSGGDVPRPSVDDSVKDTIVEGMDADIPSGVDTEPVTAKAADEGMTPSVTYTCVETVANIEEPTLGRGVDDTMDIDIQEKLSKEERVAKRARKAERKAKRAAEKAAEAEAVEDDVPEEAKESVPKKIMPSVTQPTVYDEWLPEHEPQGDNAEETQESDEEDIADVITKRRKITSKLKLKRTALEWEIGGFPRMLMPYPLLMCF
ncbi:hypothetical protein LIER_18964 [Lithospermum erythrorhizon]|uniref:Uncharacterized protein n=1 Tax=Lithospermum erythrorhizon TaxID=34254 RepID=A0AAV3QFY6_LITER